MSKNDKLCCSLCSVSMFFIWAGLIGYAFGWNDGIYTTIGGILVLLFGLFNFEP